MSGSTFSYAQAAKGLVASKPASNTSSNIPSGAVALATTPATQTASSEPSQTSKHVEQTKKISHKETEQGTSKSNQPIVTPIISSKEATTNGTGSISPPTRDMIEESVSTLHRDDDMSSIPNASSESTWENVSQASAVAEKGTVATETLSKEERGSSKDESWIKVNTLKDAPIPSVNYWTARMQTQPKPAINTIQKVSAPNGTTSTPQPHINGNGRSGLAPPSTEKKTENVKGVRGGHAKRDPRPDDDQNKARRPNARKSEELPKTMPPPLKDETSWPTPELAQEDRKKSIDKTEKPEVSKITKKHEWKKVEVPHNIVWNTQLANPASKRGGRAGGRGGRDAPNARTSPPRARPARSPIDKRPNEGSAADVAKREHGQELPASDQSRTSVGEDGTGKRLAGGGKENSSRDRARRDNKSPTKALNQESDASIFPAVNGQQKQTAFGGKGKKVDTTTEASKREANTSDSINSSGGQSHGNMQNLNDDPPSQIGDSASGKPTARNVHAQQNNRRGSIRGRGGYQGFQGHHQPAALGYGASPNLAFKSPPLAQDPYWGANQGHRTYRQTRAPNGVNDAYGKFQNGFNNGTALPPINTYAAAPPFQYQGQAMSAVPYGPMYDQYSVIGALSMQIEYYFSLENILHDMFLRKHMDSQGFVDLEFIAQFKRIQLLTKDMNLVKFVCQSSLTLEYILGEDGKSRVRRLDDWKQWILPMDQREVSAQHDGVNAAPIATSFYPGGMDPQAYGSRHASLPLPLGSPNHGQQFNGQMYNQQYFGPMQGETSGRRYQGSPPQVNQSTIDIQSIDKQANGIAIPINTNQNDDISSSPGITSDPQVNGLMLMTRTSAETSSKDTASQGQETISAQQPQDMNTTALIHGVHVTSGLNEGVSTSSLLSDYFAFNPSLVYSRSGRSHPVPLPNFSTSPKEFCPQEINPTSERYVDVHKKALEQRRLRACSTDFPVEMAILYQFWSHYLVRSFNSIMFEEFQRLAQKDFARFDNVIGMHNLAIYFAGALKYHSPMPTIALESLFRLAKAELELPNPKLRTLRTFQSIWQENNVGPLTKNSILESLSMNPSLSEALDTTPAYYISP